MSKPDIEQEMGVKQNILPSVIFLFIVIALAIIFAVSAHATTPGKPTVTLSWQDSCSGTACPLAYNIYRGAATGVCSGTPTPLQTGVTSLSWVDSSVVAGSTYVYAVSAVPAVGGESNCSTELQVTVQTAQTPNNLQAH